VLCAVFACGILLRVNYMNVTDYREGVDEGFYVRYGAYMATEEGASIRALSNEYIRNSKWQLFPNPLRAGHILLSGWWMKMLHRSDFIALSRMSCFFSILLLFLGYWFARRLFDKQVALLALILLASSPIALAMGRRALQDSVVAFFLIASLYIFYEAVNTKKSIYAVLLVPILYMSIMVKETSILLAVFFVVYLLYDRTFVRKDFNVFPLLAAIILAVLLTDISYLVITGSLSKFIQLLRIILLSPETNRYAIKYQSGSLTRYLYDFLLISPLTLIASGIFCAAYCMDRKIRSEGARYLLWFFTVLYILFSFFSKNIRYVIALDFPIRIFAVLAVWTACSKFGRPKVAVALCAVLTMAVIDVIFFRHIFIICKVYDPVTYQLLTAWKRF
jgi:4-amino-4-deoxy-L-arabinose transferase-like glycosyltransferase